MFINKIIKRRSQAIYYWLAIAAQSGFAALCYAFAIVRITKLLEG